jgi:hypothetical protein
VVPALLALLLALPPAGSPAAKGTPPPARGTARPAPEPPQPSLAEALLAALEEARFDELRDAGPLEGRCPGDADCPWPLPRVAAAPPLDLAVILLDASGRAVEAANVQLDAAAPGGRVVTLDRNLAASGIRFRRWSPERREAGAAAGPFSDADDLAPSRRHGPDFMAPYPASLFKLLVAFHVERRAALGLLDLRRPVTEVPAPPAPGEPPTPPETRPLREWVERMVVESDNRATRAVVHHLHARGEVEVLNRDLAALGLDTLRIDGSSPFDGGRWAPGEIHATAMDVARLLWLVAGGPGTLWRTPIGAPVTRAVLPEQARERLQMLLADQAFHEALSSGSRCGAGPGGIPAQVPLRFVDPATGFEAVGDAAWRSDVRPCNEAAEVRFLHKTGLTWNFASDAGIVETLPGKPFRRYVVALVSAAGTRFLDPEDAGAARHPCEVQHGCLTRKLAVLGAAIDAHAARAAARAAALAAARERRRR